jgi:hypothetical protein
LPAEARKSHEERARENSAYRNNSHTSLQPNLSSIREPFQVSNRSSLAAYASHEHRQTKPDLTAVPHRTTTDRPRQRHRPRQSSSTPYAVYPELHRLRIQPCPLHGHGGNRLTHRPSQSCTHTPPRIQPLAAVNKDYPFTCDLTRREEWRGRCLDAQRKG